MQTNPFPITFLSKVYESHLPRWGRTTTDPTNRHPDKTRAITAVVVVVGLTVHLRKIGCGQCNKIIERSKFYSPRFRGSFTVLNGFEEIARFIPIMVLRLCSHRTQVVNNSGSSI